MYREVESPEWFLLCLEPGNPSSVSLHAVPMCYCCEKKKKKTEPGWIPVLCVTVFPWAP